MLRALVHKILLRRHFWRYATFSEVAELYTSRMLRMIGINIANVFVSVYLYQHGYSVEQILLYWTAFYVLKVFLALPLAAYVARFGPKHAILLSNLLYIPSMVAFTQIDELGFVALVISGLFQSISAALYNEAYFIDFSKVKSLLHAGKELAYMNIFEKVARGLSPLVGGALAYVAGPVAVLWVAAVIFSLAAVPLFRSGEPLSTGKKLVFRGFSWRIAYRSLLSCTGIGFDAVASGIIWMLFVAVVIVGIHANNQVYAVLGGLAALIVIADVAASYLYGQLIDRRRGGLLLKAGVVVDVLTHLTRPFITTVGAVGGVNIAKEAGTTAYSMAFSRGLFDIADRSGQRVTYIGLAEVMQNFGAAVAFMASAGLVYALGVTSGLRWFYVVAAVAVLVLLLARFPLYRKP